MNNKHREIVSECFRNYKEAVLEQSKHPNDEDYYNWVVYCETQLENRPLISYFQLQLIYAPA